MQTTYNLLVRAEHVIRRLMANGALMTYQQFAIDIGLTGPNDQWTPTRQREVADILKYLAALERRLSGASLDFKRILSPTQERILRGGTDDAA